MSGDPRLAVRARAGRVAVEQAEPECRTIGTRDELLAPFLNKCPHEVLGIRLKHFVDFVQYGVDVLGELLVTLGYVGARLDGLFDLVLGLLLRLALAAVMGMHHGPLSIGSSRSP
jgi:hypothetical protein